MTNTRTEDLLHQEMPSLETTASSSHSQGFFSSSKHLPIPLIPIAQENPLSKRLRRFSNLKITRRGKTGVYINTNEIGVRGTAKLLASLPRVAGSLHIGFSGWHNFDIMAQRFSERALICDINPENTLFLSVVLKLVCQSSSRTQFITLIKKYIHDNHYLGTANPIKRNHYTGKLSPFSIKFSYNVSTEPPYSTHSHDDPENEVTLELLRETSWLYTDERFNHIRSLAVRDKIALITENILNTGTFTKIAKLLGDNTLQTDTLYISNIGEWFETAETRDQFIQTIQSLSSEEKTILIDARQSIATSFNPAQRCLPVGMIENLGDWLYGPMPEITFDKDFGEINYATLLDEFLLAKNELLELTLRGVQEQAAIADEIVNHYYLFSNKISEAYHLFSDKISEAYHLFSDKISEAANFEEQKDLFHEQLSHIEKEHRRNNEMSVAKSKSKKEDILTSQASLKAKMHQLFSLFANKVVNDYVLATDPTFDADGLASTSWKSH